MTRIVVLDEELHEGLTVVEIPASFMRAVEAGHHPPYIRMAVPTELAFRDPDPGRPLPPNIVTLRLEPVWKNGRRSPLFWYAYADDPELVLKLRAAFLPGQLSEVQRREQEAFWRGAFAAVGLR